jgi:hypothetical protein
MSSSASGEFFNIFRKRKVYYHLHNGPQQESYLWRAAVNMAMNL